MTTWSLVNTTMMAAFDIPEGVEKLIIWADKDRRAAGLSAATRLAERATKAGVQAIIRFPGQALPVWAKSVDWLDVLVNYGSSGFCSGNYIEGCAT